MKNYIYCLAALAISVAAVSCGTKDFPYEPATASGEQVYFSTNLPATAKVDANATSYDVQLNRIDTKNSITVPLTVTNSGTRFTVPTEATFSAGSASTTIPLTYDPSTLEYDVYDTISVTIADADLATEYGKSTYTFRVGLAAPYTSLGKGTIQDNGYFEMKKAVSVVIQQNDIDPSVYKIETPYKSMLGANADGNETDLIFKIMKEGEEMDGLKMPKDGIVYFDRCNTGYYHSTYGADIWLLHVTNFAAGANVNNWVYSCVEQGTSDDPEVISIAPFYYMFGVGGWNYSSKQDCITIVFPNCVYSDYSAEVVYGGKVVDTKERVSVVANVTLGDDVDHAVLALLPEDFSDEDYDAIYDGSYSVMQKITKSGDYTFDASGMEAGTYYFVVVTYDTESNVKKEAYVDFDFTVSSASEDWTPLYTVDYTYDAGFILDDDDNPYVDSDLVMYQSTLDKTRFKIEHWCNDVDFIFSFDGFGNVLVADQETGETYNGEAIMVDDLVDYTGGTSYGQSSFDAATNTFSFAVYYYCSAGRFAMGTDTCVITGDAPSGDEAPRMKNIKYNSDNFQKKKVEFEALPLSR